MKVRQITATKTTGFIAAVFMVFAFASMSLFTAGTAHADGYKHKHYGKHYGKSYGHHKRRGRHHGRHHGRHKSSTVVIFGSTGYSAFSYPAYPRRRHYFVTDRPVCRVVSKIDYWYGRKAEIGGTACPDAYGNLVVVQGSHHLIRYLY
ncbi:MAG: hypothetical protein WD407_03095 [Rhodospirillales bacterium]